MLSFGSKFEMVRRMRSSLKELLVGLAVVRRTLQGESFERVLDRELRWTVSDLEQEFVAWVDRL